MSKKSCKLRNVPRETLRPRAPNSGGPQGPQFGDFSAKLRGDVLETLVLYKYKTKTSSTSNALDVLEVLVLYYVANINKVLLTLRRCV